MFEYLTYLLKDLRGHGICSVEIDFHNDVVIKFDEIGFITSFGDCKDVWKIEKNDAYNFYTVSVRNGVIVAQINISGDNNFDNFIKKAGYDNGKVNEEIVGD